MAGLLSESLHLKHTNVSQPSVVSRSRSQQSLTASEDYYSLSSESSHRSSDRASHPPARSSRRPYMRRSSTPKNDSPARSYEGIATPVEVRQVSITPMRGVGRRRDDLGVRGSRRASPIRRKPVPSTVYESSSPLSATNYTPVPAESSTMRAISQQEDPPTPEADDTEYIRFALDQITNDSNGAGDMHVSHRPTSEVPNIGPFSFEEKPGESEDPLHNHPQYHGRGESPPIPSHSPRPSSVLLPRNMKHDSSPSELLIPCEPPSDSFNPPLTAVPPILRPARLVVFILLLTIFTLCLLFCAIWSRVRTGLCNYGTLGDGRYFVWQYLPTMIGMVLLLWMGEIESAVFRVSPFIALTADSTKSRSQGVLLPLTPSTFLIPSFAHLKSGQPIITVFLFVSWLNLFTIPLLGASFNVYFHGSHWVWLATQGVIWTVIVLYILQLSATIALLMYLHRRHTGLKWDARSLADLITLVQASNTLESYAKYPFLSNANDIRDQIAEREDRLGYFQSPMHSNEICHTLGAPGKPSRRHDVEYRHSAAEFDPESGRPWSDATYNTTDPVLPRDLAASWQSYIPWFLHTTFVTLWFFLAMILLLAFLVASYLPSTRVSDGFAPLTSVLQGSFGFSSTNFLYSFVPALLGLLAFLIWQTFDLNFRRLQPYASLANPGGAPAETSLLLSYPYDAPVIVTLKAAINRHFRIALVSFVTLIAATLPILAGGIFWAQFYVSEQSVRVGTHMTAYYALTFFFTFYCLSYALIFPGRNRRLPNKGRCLADVVALVHQSRILDDWEFRSPPTRVAMVTRLVSATSDHRFVSQHDPEKTAAGAMGTSTEAPPPQPKADAAAFKASLVNSQHGLGQADMQARTESGPYTALNPGADFNTAVPKTAIAPCSEQPRYGFGRYIGRDGHDWLGIDRIGRPGRGVGMEMVVGEQ